VIINNVQADASKKRTFYLSQYKEFLLEKIEILKWEGYTEEYLFEI